MDNTLRMKTERSFGTSTTVEAVTGIGAVVLTILALSNVYPMMLTSIAAIAAGVAFLIEGISISAHYLTLLESVSDEKWESIDFAGGVTTEFIGGLSGIVLGILSLIGIAASTLLPIAALAMGATLVFSTGETALFSSMKFSGNEDVRKITNQAIKSTAGAQLLVGLGAVTLGIITLSVGSGASLILSTIAILAIGGIEFSKGSAISAKMMRLVNKE